MTNWRKSKHNAKNHGRRPAAGKKTQVDKSVQRNLSQTWDDVTAGRKR